VAEAVRDLTWRRRNKRLTQKDEDLLTRGREFLAAEIALATDTQVIDAQATIEDALQTLREERPVQAATAETAP